MMMDVCMHDANIIITTSNFVYIELSPTIMCFTERLFFKIQEIVKNAANTEIFMKASR